MEKIKISEFKIPDFLLNHSTNDVHRKMKSILPVDLDVSTHGTSPGRQLWSWRNFVSSSFPR